MKDRTGTRQIYSFNEKEMDVVKIRKSQTTFLLFCCKQCYEV